MKTLKSLLVIAMLTVVSYGVNAQSGEITANAVVTTNLTIAQQTPMNLGNLSSSTDGPLVLDPQGGVNNAYVGVNAEVGVMKIQGDSTQTVMVTYDATITLTKVSGTETFVLNLNVSEDDVDDDAANSTLLASGGTVALTGGQHFLFVGGSTSAAFNGQTTGTYVGTANFEVLYN